MTYTLQGTHTVTTAAQFESLEDAQKHALEIGEVGTDVDLTITDDATGETHPTGLEA